MKQSSGSKSAVAIVSILLIANTQAFGFTISDLDPSSRYKLEKIEISGEHAFSRDAVVSLMTTKERPWYQVWKPLPNFDAQMFTDDLANIQRSYEAHGYYDAHINYDLTLDKNKVTPHIAFSEGKPIRVVTIDIKVANGFPPPQELSRSFKLPFKKGDIFDQDDYQKGAQELIDLYTSNSYAHAKVQRHAVVEVGPLQARIQYEVEPGGRCLFGDTKIAGTKKVDPKLVEEQLTYKSGEPFDSRKLVSRLVNKCSIVDAAGDPSGGLCPSEGFSLLIPVSKPAHDGALEPAHALEAAAANRLVGDQGEPALDQIEPRRAG